MSAKRVARAIPRAHDHEACASASLGIDHEGPREKPAASGRL